MIDTVMFDLDGTLLRITQDEFINTYFAELSKVFIRLGFDAKAAIKAVWAGTKAMILNDGAVTNKTRFWYMFSSEMELSGERLIEVEAACDSFYTNEFNIVKTVAEPTDIPRRIIHSLKAKGLAVVLATNPLFPPCAVETRLGWLGLSANDFILVTDYSNSSYCKPNPEYYREILGKIGKTPPQCLMVGNNAREDMCAADLGIDTYLVTDFLENETNADISAFKKGTLAEMEKYLETFRS